jgi:hypothetical protein
MANYSLIFDSTFRPFTYQELAAPIMEMSNYHEKLNDEYDKLSQQADVLEAMGKNERDKNSGTYARYKAYSDQLRKEANDLYRFGLNTESRQRLSELRRRYNTDIVPIQNAWNKRDEEAKMQIAAQMQHPELRFTRDARNTSLEEYINNPQGGFGVVNLNNITAQMSEAAKNLAKQYRSGRLENIDGYTKNFITENGLDPKLIADWQRDPTVSPTLTNMMQQVLQANGLNSEEFLNSPNGARILQEATGAAQRGAWSAVGEDKSQVIEDYGARLNAQMQKEMAVAIAKAQAAGGAGGSASGTMDESLYELPMAAADGSNPAQSAKVRALNYEKTDWNPNSKNYTVREITKYKDGKPVFDSKTQSLGELLNRQDSNKKDLNVSTYWSSTPGHEGIILATTEDGKAHRYFISADSMPENNVQNARQYFNLAEEYRKRGKNQEAREALEIAYRSLHTGLTVHNKAYDQSMVRQPSLKQQAFYRHEVEYSFYPILHHRP